MKHFGSSKSLEISYAPRTFTTPLSPLLYLLITYAQSLISAFDTFEVSEPFGIEIEIVQLSADASG